MLIVVQRKIFNQDELEKINFITKNNLLKELGEPSYIDPINNNFYYFSEKKEKRSIYNSKVKYSFVFVFEFDENNFIINSRVYDLKKKRDLKSIKDETESIIVKRGLLERIFGGVGAERELTTTTP